MVFCRNLVPILVLLVAVNSRFGLALPHQSIRLDPSDVPFIYNLNASWTETCPGGETDCAPGETCCPLKNQGKVLWNRALKLTLPTAELLIGKNAGISGLWVLNEIIQKIS